MAPVSPVAAEKQTNDTEEPDGFLLSKVKSSNDTKGEGSLEASSCVAVRPGKNLSTADSQASIFQTSNEKDSRAGRSESSGSKFLRQKDRGGSRTNRRLRPLIRRRRSSSAASVVRSRRGGRRTRSSSRDAMQRAGSRSSNSNKGHGSNTELGNLRRQVSVRCREEPEHQRSGRRGSNSSSGRNPVPPVNANAETVASSPNHHPAQGRWLVSSSSTVTLQRAGSAGSWTSGRQGTPLQGGTSSSSLQKHLVVLEEGSLNRSSSRVGDPFGPHTVRRLRRDGWEPASPQRSSAVLLHRRSTSSVSLANTPPHQLGTVLYSRHHSNESAAAAEALRRVPEGAATAESPRGSPQETDRTGRHLYSRAITRLRGSTTGAAGALHRGGVLARAGTMVPGHHHRSKTVREANIVARRRRRSRKPQEELRPAVTSRLRRMLQLRSFSTLEVTPGSIQYHRVYLVLGLLHHRNGGDLVQNGFVCLRACDVTNETNALIAEASTFIWDRDRAYADNPVHAATRPGAAAAAAGGGCSAFSHMTLGGGDSWMSGGVLFRDNTAQTGGPLAAEWSSPGGGTCRGGGAASAGFSYLSPHDTHMSHMSRYGSSLGPMTVFTIGVRVAVKPSTPSEERKTTIYLRDYLASQLATYPFLRHYVLITKHKKRRFTWPFSRQWRQPAAFSITGTGQYSAIVNASTQVDGLTPLEVCVVHRPKRRSSALSKGMTGAFSFMASIAGTLRSSIGRERHRST